jgi:hypothetical protein
LTRDWLPEMQARILDRDGCIIWSATPQAGTEHLYELHERAEQEAVEMEQPSVEEFEILLRDNAFMSDRAKLDFERNMTSDAERLVRIGGQFAIDSFKVYPELRDGHFYDPIDIPREWTRYMFVDPGRQRCAVLFVAVPPRGSGHVYFYDELYIKDCDARKFAAAVADKLREVPLQAMWIDRRESRKHETGSGLNIERQYVKALRRQRIRTVETGTEFYGAPDDVKARIEAFRGWLVGDEGGVVKVKISKRCVNLRKEAERYRYKRGPDGLPTDEPVKRNDHLCDCAGYAALVDPPYQKPPKASVTPNQIHKALAAKKARRRKQQGSDRGHHINLGPGS